MQAILFKHANLIASFEVKDRFDFEDKILHHLFPARLSRDYREHGASPRGIRVVARPGGQAFEARPYLEFGRHLLDRTHFHVMQEGLPTGFEVVLS